MKASKWRISPRELDLIKCLPCTWVLTANQETVLCLNTLRWFSLTLQICREFPIADALNQITLLKEGGTGVTPTAPHRDEWSLFTRLVLLPSSHTHFHEQCRGCQLHCRLYTDNLLTSRILACQTGCLYNCCLCQSLCEKCHQENEVRKQSCSVLLMEVTTTESITCFQDSFENIFNSWEKRHLWNWKR